MVIILIIFGVLMILGGISCIFTPVATFSALGWLAALAIIVTGISSIFRYAAGRDGRSIWELIGGILGTVLGAFLLFRPKGKYLTNTVIAYAAALWLVVTGICGIMEGWNMRKVNRDLPSSMRTSSWLLVLLLGVITAAIGVACFFRPIITAVSVGLLIGVSIMITGIKTLILAFQLSRWP